MKLGLLISVKLYIVEFYNIHHSCSLCVVAMNHMKSTRIEPEALC
jgi:hypothetical protein